MTTTLVRCSFLIGMALLAVAATAAEAPTMKAIQYQEHGPASVLRYVDLPRPKPQAGEVLVKVAAAGVNTIDWENRLQALQGFAPGLPVIPGYDLAGAVVERGSGVSPSRYANGTRVFAMLPLNAPRAYAEYVNVPVDVLALQPKKLDAIQAAAVPLVALTAWQALFDAGKLEAGQSVLIHGAAGGVGHFAVQLASNAGARVIGTSSAANLDFVRSLGAAQAIDYRAQRFEDEVRNVDLVFDTVGGDTLERSYQVLRKGGTLVSIAGWIDPKKAAARGINGKGILVVPNAKQLGKIASLLDAGALKVQIDTVYPLREAARAHEKSEGRHLRGRLVLDVASASDGAK